MHDCNNLLYISANNIFRHIKIMRNIADMKPFQFKCVDLRADRHSSNIKYNPLPNKMVLHSIHCQIVEENLNPKCYFFKSF